MDSLSKAKALRVITRINRKRAKKRTHTQPHPTRFARRPPLQERVFAAPRRLFLAVRLWVGLAVHAGEW
jgi:hypothetical protein